MSEKIKIDLNNKEEIREGTPVVEETKKSVEAIEKVEEDLVSGTESKNETEMALKQAEKALVRVGGENSPRAGNLKKRIEYFKDQLGIEEKESTQLENEEIFQTERKEKTVQVEKTEGNQETWTNLEDTRNEYLRLHREYLQQGPLSRVRSALGISPRGEMSPELLVAKENYDNAKKDYSEKELEDSLKKIDESLPEEEKNKIKAEINNKIFNIVVLDELGYLYEAQAESHPPLERGIFMKAYDRWASLSRPRKLIYSTIMLAGLAGYASLAVPMTASAAAIGMGGVAGKKLLRGSFGMLFSSLAGRVFDRQVAGERETLERETSSTEAGLRGSFNINNLSQIENQYKDLIDNEKRVNRNILIRKALVMGGAGMTSAVGLGMVDNYLAGIEDTTTMTPQTEIEPTETNIETAIKGDSVWKMAENQLEKHYGDKFTELEEAQKTYLIDAIKDKIAENPDNFGLGDVDEVKVGQKIDFSPVFADESEINKFFEKSNALSDVDKENILADNQKNRAWMKENPGSKLDSEQVNEILNPVTKTTAPDFSDLDKEAIAESKFEGKVGVDEVEIDDQQDSENLKNSLAQDSEAIKDSVDTVQIETIATNNMANRLSEIGRSRSIFNLFGLVGGDQFIKGGEWNLLKDIPANEVLNPDYDYYKILNTDVNGATNENLKGLNNYLQEAGKEIGNPLPKETIEAYLKRFEVSRLNKINN